MRFCRPVVLGTVLVVAGIATIGALFALGAMTPRDATPTVAASLPSSTPRAYTSTPTIPLPSLTPTAMPSSTPVPAATDASTVTEAVPTPSLDPVATLTAAEQGRCGSLIAYVRDGGLWLMNTDGGNQRELIRGAKGRPAWSPDGRSLAFQAAEGPGLRVADLGAGQVRSISAQEACFATDPAWSPDGETIAYRQVCGPDDSAAGTLALFDIAAGRVARSTLADISSPAWSPDGTRIAAVHGRVDRFPDTSILICKPDGTACTAFSDRDYVKSIAWSPNGRYIAASVVGDPHDTTGIRAGATAPKVRLLPIDGGREKELTGMDPAWAPDSGHLLRTAGSYGLAIYVVDIDGSKYKQLAPGASPAWQPCAGGQ